LFLILLVEHAHSAPLGNGSCANRRLHDPVPTCFANDSS
jgi:hypothetical protein